MTDASRFHKYPPPAYPLPRYPSVPMGLALPHLVPPGLEHPLVCADDVFPLLDDVDAAAVRARRAYWASWLADEAAMNAPFLSLLRGAKA